MKRSFVFCLSLFVLFQAAVSVWAGDRANIETAKSLMNKIENNIKEDNYDEADRLWKKAYDLIEKTYDSTTMLNQKSYVELKNARDNVQSMLIEYREKIDDGIIHVKIRHGKANEAIKYLENQLSSPYYHGVDSYYISNSYYHTGMYFQEEKDYKHAQYCYTQAKKYLADASDTSAKMTLSGNLLDSLYELYLVQGDYEKTSETLALILKTEKRAHSVNSSRYLKYKEIYDTFPIQILSALFDNHPPQEAFEQFCLILDGDYGEKLSVQDKNRFYEQAAVFFEEKSKPELITECKQKQLENYEHALEENTYRLSEKDELLKDYAEILKQRIEEAEKNKDYDTVFEYRKKALDEIKEKNGEDSTLFREECTKNMDYFFGVGKNDYARNFFEILFAEKEQMKRDSVSSRNNYIPFIFLMFDLSDFAQNYNRRSHILYEPKRQNEEAQRCIIYAPQGDDETEFAFYKSYYRFLQNVAASDAGSTNSANELVDMIKNPVFQQIEYFQPILNLGTYFQKNRRYDEAVFCANLAEKIVSFYKAPDSPENIFPILLRAAALKDSGNSEEASAEIETLITNGILQRMARQSIGKNSPAILDQWPFGKMNASMNPSCLSLMNSAKAIPDSILEKNIICYQEGTYPISIIIKLANQYEKAGQYTQALLLYQFTEKFYSDSSASLNNLKEIVDSLEEKRKI